MDQAEQSLHTLLNAHRIAGHDPTEIAHLFGDIVRQVEALHKGGVVHSDLKTRNILLMPSPDGPAEVILCDLDAGMPLPEAGACLYRPWDLKQGSSGYYSPEVARWVEARSEGDIHSVAYDLVSSAALDVWSLGMLLFELCAGQHLFSQASHA